MNKIIKLAEVLEDLALHQESLWVMDLIKESSYNGPRVGKKRWSIKQKRGVDCNNPKGFLFLSRHIARERLAAGAIRVSFVVCLLINWISFSLGV